MKPGAVFVNASRGMVVDDAALREHILSGHLSGAAIDVYEVEPATDNILFSSNNVICTPHLGASTREAQENVAMQIAEQLSNALRDRYRVEREIGRRGMATPPWRT